MSAFKRVFAPLDLEIIDRVYEAAWAQIEAREPFRDKQKDGERQEALRKRIFAVAGSSTSMIYATRCWRLCLRQSQLTS